MKQPTRYQVIYIDGLTKTEHSNSVRYDFAMQAHNAAIETIESVRMAYPKSLIEYRVEPVR